MVTDKALVSIDSHPYRGNHGESTRFGLLGLMQIATDIATTDVDDYIKADTTDIIPMLYVSALSLSSSPPHRSRTTPFACHFPPRLK